MRKAAGTDSKLEGFSGLHKTAGENIGPLLHDLPCPEGK